MKTTSQKAVLVAMLGNGFVALIKLVAFLLSNSDAMLSESIHSFADTGNQALLYIGIRRSLRARDDEFHYGYAAERFVFGLLSAAGIFFLGCGVTMYHGIHSVLNPVQPQIDNVTFAVLGISALIEGSVFFYAFNALWQERGELTFWRHVRERADPAAVAVLLEDSAAVLGLGLAALGIVASYATGVPLWDSLASIAVGLILGGIALYLVLENRELLLGRAVPETVQQQFEALLREWPSVRGVRDVKTRQLTPESFVLKAELAFDPQALIGGIDALVPKTPDLSRAERDRLLRMIADATAHAIALEIDRIEAAIRKSIPQARHIDLELDRTLREDRSIEG